MGLSFTISAGPRQRSRSRVRVPRDHILLSHIRDLLNLDGQIPVQEQGGRVTPSATAFPCRLLGLAGVRGRYSNPPPQGGGHNSHTLKSKAIPVTGRGGS
jgi:hypothetical protein